ncbi:hypothetical protein SLEP1_g58259 [Rubroshorea leprosula]|uniref:Uncharacterized protein n=1 Tax=Rubroshorea leprosula TaxID=152421 RepID=A0AAV5MRJ1_9ROSI|nr:hypothetical protein SLEP1_g58259 [Rubroshorea leprosula]
MLATLAFLQHSPTLSHASAASIPLSVNKSNLEQESKDAESEEIELKANGHLVFTELDFEDKKNDGFKGEHEKSQLSLKEHDCSNMALEPCADGKYDFQSDEVTGMTVKGSIGGRLRQRRWEGEDHNEQLSENESEKEKQMLHGDSQHDESNIGTESSSKLKKRLALVTVSNADGIAGRRLRRRWTEGTNNDTKVLSGMNKNTSDDKAINNTSSGKEAGGKSEAHEFWN